MTIPDCAACIQTLRPAADPGICNKNVTPPAALVFLGEAARIGVAMPRVTPKAGTLKVPSPASEYAKYVLVFAEPLSILSNEELPLYKPEVLNDMLLPPPS